MSSKTPEGNPSVSPFCWEVEMKYQTWLVPSACHYRQLTTDLSQVITSGRVVKFMPVLTNDRMSGLLRKFHPLKAQRPGNLICAAALCFICTIISQILHMTTWGKNCLDKQTKDNGSKLLARPFVPSGPTRHKCGHFPAN